MGAAEHILDTAELAKRTGYERPADIARCLRKQGIHVFDGRNGPWTTLELVNYAGGIRGPAGNDPEEAL